MIDFKIHCTLQRNYILWFFHIFGIRKLLLLLFTIHLYKLHVISVIFSTVHSISSYSSHTDWEWSSSVFQKYFVTLCFIYSLLKAPRLISVRQRYQVKLQNVCIKPKFRRWAPGMPTLFRISGIRRCQFLSMFLWLSGEWVNIL